MIRLVATILAAALVAVAVPARADDAAEAKARFKKGAELYRAGQFRGAIEEFEAAYRLKPAGAIHFNVAQCREKLAEWPAALRAYEDYLREVPDASDRATVRASIHRIEERFAAAGVQALLVYTDPPGAELRLDGRPRGKTPFHTVLPPGTYALALALDGYEPVAEDVTLALGAARVIDLVLRSAPARSAAPPPAATGQPDLKPQPPPPGAAVPVAPAAGATTGEREKPRVYTWIAAGAAAAALAAGGYFGYSARQDEDALASMPQPNGADARKYAESAQSNARKANAMYAVAGVAAAAGVTLFFVERKF